MKAIFKKTLSIVLSALICLSFTACGASPDKKNMVNLHKYLAHSEQEVLNYLEIKESDISDRREGENQVDIVLSEPFKYNGTDATVILMFANDCMYAVQYIFNEETDTSAKAAYKYTKDIEKEFDKKYKTPDNYKMNPSISDLDEKTYISTTETTTWRNDWLIGEPEGAREKLGAMVMNDDSEFSATLELLKLDDKTCGVKINIWA